MSLMRTTGYDRTLLELKSMTVDLGFVVGEHLAKAIPVLENKDGKATDIDWRASDKSIDQVRDIIVNRSTEIMSLMQLRPQDIHWILGYQRIAQELERIADYACDLAELSQFQRGNWPLEIPEMGKYLLHMFESDMAILTRDEDDKIIDIDLDEEDDKLDDIYARLRLDALSGEREKQGSESALTLLLARTMERMGDHMVNVAEALTYIRTGKRCLVTKAGS